MHCIIDLLEARGILDKPDALFVDLGSGDGRVVDAVVRTFKCRCVGIELDDSAVEHSREKLGKLPPELTERAKILHADMREVDMSEIDVLFIYLPQSVQR